jgi:hypothetical protein
MRGKEYLATVGNAKDNLIPGAVHNPSRDQNDPSKNGRLAKKIAKDAKVGEATIKRDAQFAAAVDRIEEVLGVSSVGTRRARARNVVGPCAWGEKSWGLLGACAQQWLADRPKNIAQDCARRNGLRL